MSNKPKILYIITQSEFGGAGRYVFDLATALAKEFEVVVAAGGQEELFDLLESAGIKTFRLKHLVREIDPINDLAAVWEIKKLIKTLRPDVVHLNSSKAGVVGALGAKLAGIKKVVYTAHGFVFNEPLPWMKKNLYIFLERFTAKFKTAIICVSEFDRQTGLKYKIASDKKLVTIYNGIEMIDFLNRKTAREKLGLPAENFIVGTIANFYPTKGLNYLIAAAAEVIKQNPNIIFQLIGFGDLADQLQAEVKKYNLENNFKIFDGKILNGQGKIYLKAFDAFALSSVKEGLPYTILEAMQAGLPIVATKVGGIPETIQNEKNGLLVESKNSQAIAKAILRIANDKNLAQEFGRQAEIVAQEKFLLPGMIAKTKTLY
ncbi:MAG: glycosyltransferase family 4 protein [Candidatus Buchananbacteria bacterium]